MLKRIALQISLILIVSLLSGCSDNDKKIIGTWQRTVTENDGGRYVETYVFHDGKKDKRVEYSLVPQDYDHIGFKASGTWDTDLLGNLKLYLDPGTATAAYNYHPDEWQQAQISLYIAKIKMGLSLQWKEMEDASFGLEITDDTLIIESVNGKDRFDRVRFLSPSNNTPDDNENYNFDESGEDYEGGDYAVDDGPQDTPEFFNSALAVVPDLYLALMPNGNIKFIEQHLFEGNVVENIEEVKYIKDNGAYIFDWGSGVHGDNKISVIHKNTMYTVVPSYYSDTEFWDYYWDKEVGLNYAVSFNPESETVFLKTTEGIISTKLSSIPKEDRHNVIWN